MINDGLDLSWNAVLCYTPSNRHVGALKRPQTWWRIATAPVSLGRVLNEKGVNGVAFTYVLEGIDPGTQIPFEDKPHWHVQSEFLRRERRNWQRWNAATNRLQPLSVVD